MITHELNSKSHLEETYLQLIFISYYIQALGMAHSFCSHWQPHPQERWGKEAPLSQLANLQNGITFRY